MSYFIIFMKTFFFKQIYIYIWHLNIFSNCYNGQSYKLWHERTTNNNHIQCEGIWCQHIWCQHISNTIHSFPFTGVFITMRYKLHSIHCNLVASLYKCFGIKNGRRSKSLSYGPWKWYSTAYMVQYHWYRDVIPFAWCITNCP